MRSSRLTTNLNQFQGQSKFYTWLVRIAVNEALMKLRRHRPGRTVSLDEDVKTEEDSVPREVADWSPNPEQQYNQAELKEILSKTIQGLANEFSYGFCAERCGRAFDRRNRRGVGAQHSGGQIAAAAGAVAVAGAAQPLLPET